jgi:hypothetical protein
MADPVVLLDSSYYESGDERDGYAKIIDLNGKTKFDRSDLYAARHSDGNKKTAFSLALMLVLGRLVEVGR